MDGALCAFIREGIEVELFLRGRDIELHVLLAVDTTEARSGIEGARASCVVEAHLLDINGNLGVGQHEATEGRDTVERDLVVNLLLTDGHVATAEIGICVASGVGELDLGEVRHRGVATGAMAHNYQEVVALSELEGGLAEIGFGRGLINLLDARAAFIVDSEVKAGTGLGGRGCSTSEGLEWGLLDAEDRDPEVLVSGGTADHTFGVNDGLLAGEEGECA